MSILNIVSWNYWNNSSSSFREVTIDVLEAEDHVCDFEDMLMAMMKTDLSRTGDLGGESQAKEILKGCLDRATKFLNTALEPSAQERTRDLSKRLRHHLESYCRAETESNQYSHLANALNAILHHSIHADPPLLECLPPPEQPTLYIIHDMNTIITNQRYINLCCKPGIFNVHCDTSKTVHDPTCSERGRGEFSKATAERQKLKCIETNVKQKEPEPQSMNPLLFVNAELQEQKAPRVVQLNVFHSVELTKMKGCLFGGQLKGTYVSSLLQQADQLETLRIPDPSEFRTSTDTQSHSTTSSELSESIHVPNSAAPCASPKSASGPIPDCVPSDTSAIPLPHSSTKPNDGFGSDPSSSGQPKYGMKRPNEESQESSTKRPRLDSDPSVYQAGKQPAPAVQASIYAADRLSSAPWFAQTPALIFQDDILHLWWFDRAGVIRCKGINFLQNLPHFVVLVALLQSLRGEIDSPFRLVNTETDEYQITIEGHVYGFKLNDMRPRFTRFGRGTTIVPITNVESGKEYIMKMYWGGESKACEADILRHIEKLAREKRELDILEHLPKLISSCDFTSSSTSEIRRRLGLPTKGSRKLYCLVFDKLEPITRLTGMEFWKAYWETVHCHYRLWEWGIHHGDISVGNLMQRDGKGVLNDFDLARMTCDGVAKPEGFWRAGTMPFMALDLLTDKGQKGEVERLYRHDLESFMWVLLWICLCFEDGKQIEHIPERFSFWLRDDVNVCHDAKLGTELEDIQCTSSYSCIRIAVLFVWHFWSQFWGEKAEAEFAAFDEREQELQKPSQSTSWTEPSSGDILQRLISHLNHPRLQKSDPTLINVLPSVSS